MNDDWRLRVDVREDGIARELTSRLERSDLTHALGTAFDERVIVSRDGSEVFCYAATREQAEATRGTIDKLAAEHGWEVEFALHRWHPAAERAELMEQEREESAEQAYPEFEVRVRCVSRGDASALARQLREEGYPVVQRGEFLVLGAADEDSARELAARVRAEAPPGSDVVAEGSVPEVVSEAPFATPFNPFAVFGGLGGG